MSDRSPPDPYEDILYTKKDGVATATINRTFGPQKSVGLARLRNLCEPAIYADLKLAVEKALRTRFS